MNGKGISVTLAMALMATLVAACGGGTNGKEVTGAPEPKAEEPAKPVNTGPREITMYTGGASLDEKGFNEQYGDAIRKKFPDVKLNFVPNAAGTKMADLIASNTTIDIVFDSIGYANTMKDFKIQVDLTPFISARKMDLNKFEPSAIEFQRKLGNGVLYSLPVWTASAGLFYNKDLFDKFGVPYPKDNMTWTEVFELAKRLTRNEGGVQYVGYVTSPGHQANTNQLGMKFVDAKTGKATLDSDDWAQYMKSIVQFYQISGMEWNATNSAIAAQRAMFEKDRVAAMYTNYSGGTPPEDMNWDVVSVPYYDKAPGVGPQSYPAYLSITNLSKNKELAYDIVSYLVSEEYQTLNTRAGRATVLNNPEIIKQYGQGLAKFKGKNVAAMFPAKRAAIGDYTPEETLVSAQFSTAYTDIVVKKKDLNTAMREANEAANKKIEELKQKK
ncbi:ABC transporter substrate-binding protein [Paenibacillus ginsengarvi]|uniref:Extracellular solute-binding protein n=1 Tax=Paenibacillus ginsengarvi TaxID=400777 RepID=A0A3B0CMZ9_9BACL|nr:extracellular solute-binding protein [Paenibacillus ginsengarvi]RKN85767.1 extracellular solute-binding protein [Paenibacillus ginsengarvi]